MAAFENLPNFRDMGGIEAANGRVVRRGRLFRSGLISRPMKNGPDGLSALGIDVVFDLRSVAERVATGSIAPALGAVHEVVTANQAGLKHAKPVDWVGRLVESEFDGELARRMMLDAYRKMPRALAGVFPALFDHCLSPAAGGVLVHCVAGKDRTGFVCAMLLWALGAPISAIHGDYLRSADGFARTGFMAAMLRRAFPGDIPGRAAEAAAVLGDVRTEFLDAAIDQVVRDFASIDAYLAAVGGLGEARKQQLRQFLLVDSE